MLSRSLLHKCSALFTPSAVANSGATAESAGSAELGARPLLGCFAGNGIFEMSQQLPRRGRILTGDYELHRASNIIETPAKIRQARNSVTFGEVLDFRIFEQRFCHSNQYRIPRGINGFDPRIGLLFLDRGA